MNAFFALLAAVLFAASASAQTTFDPQVAYTVVSSKSQSIYLANADGSRKVLAATVKGNINGLDLSPSGNLIAFSDSQGIKLVPYAASNTGVVFGPVQLRLAAPTASALSMPDFSADGSRLIYRDATAGAVRAIGVVSGAPVYEIWTVFLDSNDQLVSASRLVGTDTAIFKGIEDFDTARTRNSVLVTANFPTTIRLLEINVENGAIADLGVSGYRAHFSSDDSRIIFRNLPMLGSPGFVYSAETSTGLLTRLTAKGGYGLVDARP